LSGICNQREGALKKKTNRQKTKQNKTIFTYPTPTVPLHSISLPQTFSLLSFLCLVEQVLYVERVSKAVGLDENQTNKLNGALALVAMIPTKLNTYHPPLPLSSHSFLPNSNRVGQRLDFLFSTPQWQLCLASKFVY